MDYEGRLEKLFNDEKRLVGKLEELEEQRNRKIQEATTSINQKYFRMIQENESELSLMRWEIDTIISKITEANVFCLDEIGPIMAQIMSKKEGAQYIFERLDFDEDFVYMIGPTEEKLITDRNIIVFDGLLVEGHIIIFYNANTKLSFDFGRFDYLKDFIKMVVKVKLENGTSLECLNITAEELEMLRDKFLGDSTRKLDLK